MTNFQFKRTVSLSECEILCLQKKVEKIKEGECTVGVCVVQETAHGELICEIGKETIQKKDLTCQSEYFLFIYPEDEFIVDCRKSNSPAKYIRRSCRPNVIVKPVLCDKKEIRWFLFAEGMIKKDKELFLGSDYKNGNFNYRRRCSCDSLENCLFETCEEKNYNGRPVEISFEEYLKMKST